MMFRHNRFYYEDKEGVFDSDKQDFNVEKEVFNDQNDTYEEKYYAGFGARVDHELVRKLQQWLNQNVNRYGSKIAEDGIYGRQTRESVRRLQRFLNLTFREHIKEDGLYGRETYNAVLRHYLQAGWTPPPPPIYGGIISTSIGGTIYATGGRVKSLQLFLNNLYKKGLLPFPVKVDGLYGNQTRSAVVELQKLILNRYGIPIKVDGFYGCETYNAVKRAGISKNPPLPIFNPNCANVSSTGSGTTQSSNVKIKVAGKSDKIFGVDKKWLFIGGAVLIGVAILMLSSSSSD